MDKFWRSVIESMSIWSTTPGIVDFNAFKIVVDGRKINRGGGKVMGVVDLFGFKALDTLL